MTYNRAFFYCAAFRTKLFAKAQRFTFHAPTRPPRVIVSLNVVWLGFELGARDRVLTARFELGARDLTQRAVQRRPLRRSYVRFARICVALVLERTVSHPLWPRP